jgi:hypothetical protein
MLVDINSYIGHWPFQQLQYNNCEGLLRRMNRFGVDIAVVSNLNGIFYKNTQAANEELHAQIRSNKTSLDRLIPFAVINPTYAGCVDDLKVCQEKMGMKGVRLYPKYHDYEVTNRLCIDLVKRARDQQMIVAFTLRMVDNRQRSWMDIENEWALKDVLPVIEEVRDAKYMILNVANSTQLGPEEMSVFKNADVLMDTSGRAVSSLGAMLNKFGSEKFAFGTHAPVLDYVTGLLRIEALKEAEADKKTKELLRSGNARRMLNL